MAGNFGKFSKENKTMTMWEKHNDKVGTTTSMLIWHKQNLRLDIYRLNLDYMNAFCV